MTGVSLAHDLRQPKQSQAASLPSPALTRAHLALEANAGKVVALAVLARHLPKVAAVAHALPADALATLAAQGLAWPGAAVVLLRGVVLLLRAFAVRAQAPGVAAAHAALQRAIAVAAGRAVGLGVALT